MSLREERKKSMGARMESDECPRESLAGIEAKEDEKEVCEPGDVLGKKRASRPSTFNSKNRSWSTWTHQKKVSPCPL